MNDFYVLIGVIVIAIVIMATVIKVLDFFDKHPKPDGELQIFSDENKDTYRFVVYNDIDSLKNSQIVKFKVYDLRRDKNKANNENDRKEDIL